MSTPSGSPVSDAPVAPTEPPVATEPPVSDAPVAPTEPPVATEAPVATEPPVSDSPVAPTEPPVATEPPVSDSPVAPTEPPVATEPPVSDPADPSDAPSPGNASGAPALVPTSAPTLDSPSPVENPTTMTSFSPMADSGTSYAPHERTFVETAGTLEKAAADDLTPAESFGITTAVLVFVCIMGFCFGRRFALWCHNRRTYARERQQQRGSDEAAPFTPSEQDML